MAINRIKTRHGTKLANAKTMPKGECIKTIHFPNLRHNTDAANLDTSQYGTKSVF